MYVRRIPTYISNVTRLNLIESKWNEDDDDVITGTGDTTDGVRLKWKWIHPYTLAGCRWLLQASTGWTFRIHPKIIEFMSCHQTRDEHDQSAYIGNIRVGFSS